ncbi:zonular occludens toxin domain-containing protein, partial [Photobacterium leiognathi]
MADFAVVGFKGSGKGLQAVSRIQLALDAGNKVATNLDINTYEICYNKNNKVPVIRLPDYPRYIDFQALGFGYDKKDDEPIDENKFGTIVLDEISIWMNSRNWNDKGRLQTVAWLRQARKFRWHVYYLAQSVDSVDNQTRELFEHVVNCSRTDRAYYPLIGRFLNVFNPNWGKLPRVHRAVVTYQKSVVDNWALTKVNLKTIFPSYDTEQVFMPDDMFKSDGTAVDMRSSYSILPAVYLNKWYHTPEAEKDSSSDLSVVKPGTKEKKKSGLFKFVFLLVLLCLFVYAFYYLYGQSTGDTVTPSPVDSSRAVLPAAPVVPSLLKGVYVTGSLKTVSSGITSYDYSFNDLNDKPFYPSDYGFRVSNISTCAA